MEEETYEGIGLPELESPYESYSVSMDVEELGTETVDELETVSPTFSDSSPSADFENSS
jgi:hypothetical protein